MEDTIAHEMIHAYDHLRFKVDVANLRHAACTEVSYSTIAEFASRHLVRSKQADRELDRSEHQP